MVVQTHYSLCIPPTLTFHSVMKSSYQKTFHVTMSNIFPSYRLFFMQAAISHVFAELVTKVQSINAYFQYRIGSEKSNGKLND